MATERYYLVRGVVYEKPSRGVYKKVPPSMSMKIDLQFLHALPPPCTMVENPSKPGFFLRCISLVNEVACPLKKCGSAKGEPCRHIVTGNYHTETHYVRRDLFRDERRAASYESHVPRW